MKSRPNFIQNLINSYKIVPILVCFIGGILLNEYMMHPWILVAASGFVAVVISILFRSLSFLLFIPLGLAFSANLQFVSEYNVLNYAGDNIDLEGVLYRPPEAREVGSILYIDAASVIINGESKPASGKVIVYSDEHSQSLAYGDRVRLVDIALRAIENFKNPGAFNLKRFYERQNIYARGFVSGEDQIISFGLAESYSPTLNYIDELRIKYGNFVRARFQSPKSEILNAITIGEKRSIPPRTREEFSKAGVAHVLAISGLHVGAVALAFFFLIKWILKRSEYILLKYQVPRLAAAITILPIFLYTAVAGFSTSTVRAFIMISIYLISIVIGKQEHRLNTLCAAALILLLWHPWSLFELSFQLSFSAVFAILLAHKFYPFKFRTLEDKFYSLLKTTIAAALITFPLVANSFGILPLISIPANLVLVPLVEFIIVPISLISFIAFQISPYIAEPIMQVNIFFIDMLIFGVELFLKTPYSSLTVPPMNTVSWIIFLALALCIILNSRYSKIKYLIPVIIIGFIATLIYPIPGKSIDGELRVNFLDAGDKKNVVLIELAEDQNILISEGGSNIASSGYIEKVVVTNYLLDRGIRQIDKLIVGSTNKDRLAGAVHITNKFDVAQILTKSERLSSRLWGNINEKEIKWTNLQKSYGIIPLGSTQLELIILKDVYFIEDSSDPYPIVFKLTSGDSSILFGESLELESVQKELIELHDKSIMSSVLYLPETQATSTLAAFIDEVAPKVIVTKKSELFEAMIKQGKLNFDDEIVLLDTYDLGALSLTLDGDEFSVKSFQDEKIRVLY